MDFFRSLLSDVFTIAVYCAVFAGIHKLFQMATTLTEIKEVLQSQRRIELPAVARPLATAARGITPGSAAHDASDDEATAYAQNLLRAVNAEQRGAEPKAV